MATQQFPIPFVDAGQPTPRPGMRPLPSVEKSGPLNEEQARARAKRIVEIEDYYRQILQTKFQQMTRNWGLYLAQKREFRNDDEKWRANIHMPYPYSGVETMVAAVSDLLNSSDPIIQATAENDRRGQEARAVEMDLDYILTQNRWRLQSSNMIRGAGIQGFKIGKVVYRRKTQAIRVHNSEADKQDWIKRVDEAQIATNTRAPVEPRQFEQWRKIVMTAYPHLRVPEYPNEGRMEMVEYEGPEIQLPSDYDFRFDPYVSTVQEQEVFIQRVIKSKKWLERMTREGKFNPKAVQFGLDSGTSENRFSEWEREVAEMAGFPPRDETDNPLLRDKVELFEVYTPYDEVKYGVILNREIDIAMQPREMPYWHGHTPFFVVRNMTVPRPAPPFMGMSEYQQTKDLYREMNTLRSLRLDAVLLAVLPIFLRLGQVNGINSDNMMKLRPGQILTVSRPDAIQQLIKSDPGIMAGFRELMEIKMDIDETNATTSNVRGAAATVGRVSATESERRVAQALVRQKDRVMRIEEDLQEMITQILMIRYQFSDPEVRVKSNSEGIDPVAVYNRASLLESMRMDYRFRAATKAIDKALTAQQLMQFASTFGAYLLPQEMRKLMKRVYDSFSLKGVHEVISAEGDAIITTNPAGSQLLGQSIPGLAGAGGAAGALQGGPGGYNPHGWQAC